MYTTAKSNQSEIRILSILKDQPLERRYLKIESKKHNESGSKNIAMISLFLVSSILLIVLNMFVLFQFHSDTNFVELSENEYAIPHSLLDIYE